MASNDIKQKIVLEGEKQYRDAIKDAQRTLKTLRSELKAETAEMGANATAQQKNEAKVKSLKKQIAEQEKIVKANRDALEEVKQKYGDNADAVAKYEQKLNESRTALANMKNELDSVGGAMKTVQGDANLATIATNSVADSLGKIGDVAQGISDSIEGIFTGMVSAVKEAVTKVWAEVVDIAARANNWSDTAAYLGSTASDVQMWDRAISAAQGDFSKLTAAITKLKYGGKNDKIAEYFGISDVNYTDDLKYTTDLLSIMAEKKEEMVKAGTWDKAMGEIFGGRKSAEVEWFVNNWETILGNLETFDAENGGFGLTGEELDDMNELYLLVGETQRKWQALKDSITTKLFAGVVFNLTTNANNILDAFNEYFNAETQEERDAALEKIKANILAAFETIRDAINDGIKIINEIAEELKESDDPTMQTLGEIMGGLASALEWFTEDNMKHVVDSLKLLLAFWVGAKVATMIANIAAFASHITTIAGANGIGAAASGAAAGSSWGTAFASAVLKAAPWLIGLYTLLNPSSGSDAIGDNTLVDENGNLTREAVEYGYQTDENGEVYIDEEARVAAAVQTFWDLYRSGKLKQEGIDELYRETMMDPAAMQSLMEAIYQFRQDNGDKWKGIEDLPATFFSDMWKFTTNGGNSGNTDGLTSGDARGMTDAVNRMPAAVQRGMSNIRVVMDGNIVGRLVASEVSRQIAEYIV